MRKILYSLLIFASVFFTVDKISAANYRFQIMDYFLNYNNESHNLKDDLDNIIDVAKSNNYNILIVNSHYSTPGTGSGYCNTQPTVGNCKYIMYYTVYLFKNDYIPSFTISASGFADTSLSSNMFKYQINVDNNYQTNYNLLINSLSNNDLSIFTKATSRFISWFSNTNDMLYDSTVDYTISSLGSGNTYFFGENQLSVGNLIPAYKKYIEVEEPYNAKRSIEFNSSISSFDIYVDKDDELTDLNYKINYVDYNDYTTENITKSKLYTVMFYGLKNENGLYHWEMLDDCTNWDYPNEYCHVKSKFEQLESELNKEGFTVEGYIDFLDIFNEYDTVRVVLRLDNALTGKIDYWDKNMKIAATDVDVNYFGFDYSRNLSDSDLYRYTIFSTKEKNLSGNLYIISQSKDITINYFDTKYANFKEYSSLADVKKQDNFWLFNYENIGLDKNLGFYLFTDRNLSERLVYQFYTNTGLYFSYNDSDTLDDTIYIDNNGNSTNGNIAIDPDELMNYEYETIDDLFENITKFNEKINVVSQEIHKVIQYAYDSLNIYIKSFLISIFTVILVAGTIVLIRR